MPRTPTDRAPQRPAREQPLARKISALRPLSSDARAQQVTDVVDAFRRLRGSVVRFIRMFSAAHAENAQDDALSAMGFRELLSTLEDDARTARFTRLPELERAIGQARRLERTRDDVFSDSFSNDPAAMRDAVAALERVDVLFVGLCVEYVMERHAPASRPVSPSVPASPSAALPLTDRPTALC
ncbi:hypothetical protein WK39_10305 [Burkholderia cepacia]|uniref:hypothetical protein n=1 Tax=Burkholderia cepacia TaxID=292 RepID=UPI00075A7EF5|nr:hypothetical protein [Burkholderia cepacia]KVS62049.1 hypothetical protein WK39_10305 [Burkholderia cepacia]KVS75020.1 hypothetical protein WK40_34990 [Burkholderia cepacia]RRA08591.1 hypothetical protein DF055_04210 [Burkholderia cepacia]RRA12853.1 hypothetical protein DF054_03760 [Burkholderia cepacia]